MHGIVLCGGESRRMGRDKGLLPSSEQTWAQATAANLRGLDIPVHISVNPLQGQIYSGLFDNTELIPDNAALPVKGPLLGVLSAHLRLAGEDLFVLACDLPLMQFSLLKELYNHSHEAPGSDVYLFANDGAPEPLCAIYTAKALSHIHSLLLQGHLKKFSMKYALDQVSVYSLPVNPADKNCFRNVNAHADLNGL